VECDEERMQHARPRLRLARLRFVVLALLALPASASCVQPGFAASPAPGGPALITTATLGEPGHADVTIEGHELGALFGLSFHVTVAAGNASLDDASTTATLALDRLVARVDDDGNDVAFGGTRLDPATGDVAIDDGSLAAVHVTAQEAGDVELRIERAVVRRADGSFIPVAVAGGTLTLEGAQ
jgi:hypothetical protein